MPPPASKASEPPESGWDDATHLSSSAVIAAATEVRDVPPVAPVTPAAQAVPPAPASPPPTATPQQGPPRAVSSGDLAPVARRARSSPDLQPLAPAAPRPRSSPDLHPEPAAAAPTAAAAPIAPAPPLAPAAPASPSRATAAPQQLPGFPLEVQEQLFGILRAALDATLVPLLEKQQELEARLASLHEENKRAPMASIPVMLNPSIAPGASPAPLLVDRTPTQPLPSVAPKPASPSNAPRTASLVPTSYGFVIAPDAPPPRPSIETALENVGPIDMPDFGRGRRAAGRLLVGLLVAGLLAAITATVLSYT